MYVPYNKKERNRTRSVTEQEEAFRKLKEIFTTKSMLAAPDLDKEMRVEADTSDYVTEGVLLMRYKNNK